MIATHKINGQDIYASFGWVITEGVGTFLAPNVPKDRFSKDWGGESGVEYDLTGQLYFKPRVFNLTGYLIGDSIQDLLNKSNALKALLSSPGFLTIYLRTIDTTYTAILKSYTTWETATKIRQQDGKLAFRISVEFDEITNVVLPTYGLYYGSSSSFPLTQASVTSLTASEYTSPIELQTGTVNRVFSIAIQNDKNIVSVEDLDNTLFPNITSQYINRGTVDISGVTYKIMSMQVGFQYPTNHRHKITLA